MELINGNSEIIKDFFQSMERMLDGISRRGRKINCVMRRFFPRSSVGDRPAPRGCTSTPDERKVTTI